MLRISWATSGETLASWKADEVEGTAVKFLKQRLAEQIGVSRFRQRWFSHDYTEFQDDDELTLDLDVQVIVLDFMTPLPEDRMQLALACAANGSLVLEALLRDRCLPPDAADECGQTALQVAASKGHLDCMSFLARFCKMFFAIPGSAKGDLGEAPNLENMVYYLFFLAPGLQIQVCSSDRWPDCYALGWFFDLWEADTPQVNNQVRYTWHISQLAAPLQGPPSESLVPSQWYLDRLRNVGALAI